MHSAFNLELHQATAREPPVKSGVLVALMGGNVSYRVSLTQYTQTRADKAMIAVWRDTGL